MADFSIASQIKPVQLPDQLQQYAQFNQLALHQAQLAEVQRAANEQNQLRQITNPYSPEGIAQGFRISPKIGMELSQHAQAQTKADLEQRKLTGDIAAQGPALQTSRAEAAAKTLAFHRETAPVVKDQASYDIWRANLLKDAPQLEAQVDKIYSPEGMQRLITTHDASMKEYAAQAAEQRVQARPILQTVKNADGSESFVRIAPGSGPATPVPGGAGAPKPGEPYQDTSGRRYQPIKNAQGEITGYRDITPGGAGAPFAPPAGAPASVMMQPTAVGAPPAVGDAQAMRTAQIEGTGKNPMSSAQGLHQFIDSTFVGTAKKVFPELASKSPAEILALRGTKLADGTPIESALEQRFRTDNIASLTSAGIQPTPGNTYLAHFLGAGGARSVLGADPNTPVSQLLSPDAIAANKSVLEGKTAGDIAAWAANKFSGQPGMAASMTAGNARLGGAPAGFVPAGGAPMSLGAPTANNALMASMMAGQAAPTNMLAAPAPPQLAAPAAMPVAQAPAVALSAPAPAISDATANMSPAARAEYEKEQAKAASTQEAAKAARKEAGQNLLRTVGGDNGAKIEALIKASTSGRLQKYAAEAVGAVTGSATPGMENIATLDQLAKQMTFDLLGGKLGANISDKDRDFVAGLVANISAPETTASERVRGFRQLQNTINAWASGKDIEIGAPAVVEERSVARGANGRRGTLSGTPAATPDRPPIGSFGGK
jgi:hypothetical protein